MRDWLWKFGPTVVWRQLRLKRDLKMHGYYPFPLGDRFVRELIEMILKDSAYWPGPVDWKKFRNRMNHSREMVDYVIRSQADLAAREAISPPHFLVMRHLGYFENRTLRER